MLSVWSKSVLLKISCTRRMDTDITTNKQNRYTCECMYNDDSVGVHSCTELSDVCFLIVLTSSATPPPGDTATSSSVRIGLVGGAAGGGIVAVVIVLLIVIVLVVVLR